jgi:signal transduction histidine kinase
LGILIIIIVVSALLLLWLYLWRIKRLNHRLQEANDSRIKLFSIIGHDLKGPAGNAIQLLQIMETANLPEEKRKKMLAELKKQSVSSFELLNDLFEWGKALLQGVEVRPETFGTKGTVQKNITLLEPLAARKNIAITDNTPGDTHIHADLHHFDFVIRNLLSNAIKFTHQDGQIGIYSTGNAGTITFSVTDNGVGISQDKQSAFLKNNLPVSFGTKGEKGSGLGLLLIKEFMRANKGRIWLESKEGEGTTFYVSFPS